ncbi:hypothetical protein TNCV_5007941 [Trichonephila clavipes]|nr:hypothetical protein TNCV_5007941 [Trichonephila clavipes]
MDFTEINSRGDDRGKLLGRIDGQNSHFRTAITIIIKFALHASFVELESTKNALNEGQSQVIGVSIRRDFSNRLCSSFVLLLIFRWILRCCDVCVHPFLPRWQAYLDVHGGHFEDLPF